MFHTLSKPVLHPEHTMVVITQPKTNIVSSETASNNTLMPKSLEVPSTNSIIQASYSTATSSTVTSTPESPTKSLGSNTNTTLSSCATTSKVKSKQQRQLETYEVNYRSNVTSLFTNIENCNWDEVQNDCINYSSHIRTWVSSTGTNDPTSWCIWRRLPIHEACRRQPPIHVVQILLEHFPQSASEITQFGELPIHLACGCAASYDILNLLLVYNPQGVLVRDNGGRSPLDILKSSSSSDTTTKAINAFVACQEIITQHNGNHAHAIQQIQKKHAKQMRSLQKKSVHELNDKDKSFATQNKKLSNYKKQISELIDTMQECEIKINSKNKVESKLMERIIQLENENGAIRQENQNYKQTVRNNQMVIEEKEDKIQQLSSNIQVLVNDLNAIVAEKEYVINTSKEWEKEAQALMKRQFDIHMEMTKQRENVQYASNKIKDNVNSILENDGIPIESSFNIIDNNKNRLDATLDEESMEFPATLTEQDKAVLTKTAAENVMSSSSSVEANNKEEEDS